MSSCYVLGSCIFFSYNWLNQNKLPDINWNAHKIRVLKMSFGTKLFI